MTNNIINNTDTNTATTVETNSTLMQTPVPKPAFILIFYSAKDQEDSLPIIQELLIKAAWDHDFTVVDTAYHTDNPDSNLLEFLITDLQKQIETHSGKITVITNNFEEVDSNIPDHSWKLSTLLKNQIIDAYQGNIEVTLHKIELESESKSESTKSESKLKSKLEVSHE